MAENYVHDEIMIESIKDLRVQNGRVNFAPINNPDISFRAKYFGEGDNSYPLISFVISYHPGEIGSFTIDRYALTLASATLINSALQQDKVDFFLTEKDLNEIFHLSTAVCNPNSEEYQDIQLRFALMPHGEKPSKLEIHAESMCSVSGDLPRDFYTKQVPKYKFDSCIVGRLDGQKVHIKATMPINSRDENELNVYHPISQPNKISPIHTLRHTLKGIPHYVKSDYPDSAAAVETESMNAAALLSQISPKYNEDKLFEEISNDVMTIFDLSPDVKSGNSKLDSRVYDLSQRAYGLTTLLINEVQRAEK